MRISVIVPVYNVEKYLRQCLDSLLAQSYPHLEVILVDDGSKDSSGRICDEYAEKYGHFQVVHKANAGLGMARNTGMEHMTGDYVTFLDSDDWIEPDFIQKLYDGITENSVDVCKAGFQRITDEKQILVKRQYEEQLFPGEQARLALLPRMIGSSPSRHDSVEMCVCGVIYRASIIREHCLRFPSERELISEDLVFNIDYMQYADGACTLSCIGYNYRMNPGSLSTKHRPDRFAASRHFYQEMEKKLKGLGYGTDTLLRLKRIFFVYLRVCIRQETPKLSGKSRKACIQSVQQICGDAVVQEVIRTYPVEQLGIKQKSFLFLIKHCSGVVLQYFAERNLL